MCLAGTKTAQNPTILVTETMRRSACSRGAAPKPLPCHVRSIGMPPNENDRDWVAGEPFLRSLGGLLMFDAGGAQAVAADHLAFEHRCISLLTARALIC